MAEKKFVPGRVGWGWGLVFSKFKDRFKLINIYKILSDMFPNNWYILHLMHLCGKSIAIHLNICLFALTEARYWSGGV